jgi:hypothetical protein
LDEFPRGLFKAQLLVNPHGPAFLAHAFILDALDLALFFATAPVPLTQFFKAHACPDLGFHMITIREASVP